MNVIGIVIDENIQTSREVDLRLFIYFQQNISFAMNCSFL